MKPGLLTLALSGLAFGASGAAFSSDGFELLPGDAGSQPISPKYEFRQGKLVAVPNAPAAVARKAAVGKAGRAATLDGFEYIGGDTGWQVAQHKYVLRGGRFAHSEECDHVLRAAAAAPTSGEIDRTRRLYPGG